MLGRLDPRICNIHIDANTLDRDGSGRDALLDRFMALRDAGKIIIVVPDSVLGEAAHPNTPTSVRTAMHSKVYTLPVARTAGEMDLLAKVRAALRGNAQPGKHDKDAEHLFEAEKYGGGYFITNDGRVLPKRGCLDKLIGPALSIVTVEEFLDIYDRYQRDRPDPADSRWYPE